MVYIAGDNIISSLGFGSGENYAAVKSGATGIRRYENRYGIPEPFMASLIDPDDLEEQFSRYLPACPFPYTGLEQAAILSVARALESTDIDPAGKRVLFVFSSTKGNIALLENHSSAPYPSDRIHLWRTAQLISQHFGNTHTPVVVSNACISGAHALMVARRELEAGRFDEAIVTGVDFLSKFIISGFRSFKALSQDICKPFDAGRSGLNLGEAAATIILKKADGNRSLAGRTILAGGAVRNDANHISGPSRTGKGLYLALKKTTENMKSRRIAFINAHGTATLYNDEMESIALHRAGLDHIPVNGLKACFGHTLGAAGIVESIISSKALHEGIALKTSGYGEAGTSHQLPVTVRNEPAPGDGFIKMLSGFGGCNCALLFEKGKE